MGLRITKSLKLGGVRYFLSNSVRGRHAKKAPPLGCGGCILILVSPFLLVIGGGLLFSSKSKPSSQPSLPQAAAISSAPKPAPVVLPEIEVDAATVETPEENRGETLSTTMVADPFREWHSGNFRTIAALMGVSAESVLLERQDGKRKTVLIAKLSDEDQAYIKRFEQDIDGRCIGVSDGDTITVLEGRVQYKIRLEGIDAPESKQAFGTVSREHIAKLVFQKDVRVFRTGKDKYGRTLGHVFVGDTWVNLEQAKAGLAWHYKKYSADDRLADAEKNARLYRIGLWKIDSIPPWDFRHKPKPVAAVPKPKPASTPLPIATPSPRKTYSDTGEYTATGIPIHTGPRGGKYHISKNGKKVYERKKK